ncbi:MAG: DUF86 domain-containing protein [Imperialibacter sp.]|uniref:HepT-like ribonuclease domain-containing protein n=1 Tax=Imperialibacter sp. TaxID=2038411 RepID=UPI0032EEE4A0
MSSLDLLFLLEDILESALKIKKYTEGLLYETFINDDKTIDAVTRNFEIIGEASSRIDKDFKINNPHIEWDRLRGFRNRIVHEYFGVNYEIVWSIIEQHLQVLIDSIEGLINETRNDTK